MSADIGGDRNRTMAAHTSYRVVKIGRETLRPSCSSTGSPPRRACSSRC